MNYVTTTAEGSFYGNKAIFFLVHLSVSIDNDIRRNVDFREGLVNIVPSGI